MEQTEKLIHLFLDGQANGKQRQELADILKNDKEAAALYAKNLRVHSLLREIENEGFEKLNGTPVYEENVSFRKIIFIPAASILAAACIVLVLFLFYGDKEDGKGEIVGGSLTSYTVREGEKITLKGEMRVRAGDRIQTGEGGEDEKVTLRLDDDSEIDLGPSTLFTVGKENRHKLERGSVTCRIEKQEKGFSIAAVPVNADVRVLGTEFTVELEKVKEKDMNKLVNIALVTVLTGVVGVTPAGGDEVKVEAGNAVRVSEDGTVTSNVKILPVRRPEEQQLLNKLETRVSFDVKDTEFSKVVILLAKMIDGGNNITVDGELKDKRVTLNVSEMRLQSAIFWVSRLAGAEAGIEENKVVIRKKGLLKNPWTLHYSGEEKEEWYRKIKGKMEKRVSFNFLETPYEQVVLNLTQISGIPIILDPGVLNDDKGNPAPQNITIKLDNMKFSSAFDWVSGLAGTYYTIAHEALYISKEKNIDFEGVPEKKKTHDGAVRNNEKAGAEQVHSKLAGKPVSVDFLETPLEQTVQFLTKVSGVPIVLDPAVLVDDMGTPVRKNITLKADNMSAENAVFWCAYLAGLEIVYRDQAVFIGKDMDADMFPANLVRLKTPDDVNQQWYKDLMKKLQITVTLNLTETPLSDAATFVSTMTGMTVILGPGVDPELKVTLNMQEAPVSMALSWMLKTAGYQYTVAREAVLIQNPEAGGGALQVQPAVKYKAEILIDSDGKIFLDKKKVQDVNELRTALEKAGIGKGIKDTILLTADKAGTQTMSFHEVLYFLMKNIYNFKRNFPSKQNTPLQKTTARPVIPKAEVTAVKQSADRDTVFVMIPVGENQNVKIGYNFALDRNGTYIAKAVVKVVYESSCMAEIVPESVARDAEGNKRTPQKGDLAVLRGPFEK